jgi:hypothetical protein
MEDTRMTKGFACIVKRISIRKNGVNKNSVLFNVALMLVKVNHLLQKNVFIVKANSRVKLGKNVNFVQ